MHTRDLIGGGMSLEAARERRGRASETSIG
jgi:hypothetical protein